MPVDFETGIGTAPGGMHMESSYYWWDASSGKLVSADQTPKTSQKITNIANGIAITSTYTIDGAGAHEKLSTKLSPEASEKLVAAMVQEAIGMIKARSSASVSGIQSSISPEVINIITDKARNDVANYPVTFEASTNNDNHIWVRIFGDTAPSLYMFDWDPGSFKMGDPVQLKSEAEGISYGKAFAINSGKVLALVLTPLIGPSVLLGAEAGPASLMTSGLVGIGRGVGATSDTGALWAGMGITSLATGVTTTGVSHFGFGNDWETALEHGAFGAAAIPLTYFALGGTGFAATEGSIAKVAPITGWGKEGTLTYTLSNALSPVIQAGVSTGGTLGLANSGSLLLNT